MCTNLFDIYYNPRQTARGNTGFSPSAGKPKLVVDDLLENFSQFASIKHFEPLAKEDIMLAHDREYVEGILDCTIENGFSNKLQCVADSLPFTTGSFAAAAINAREKDSLFPNMSPTSGFHHACYHTGMGFCTFNGLMIAALLLKKRGLLTPGKGVGIIDFDAHYGNGTDDIINKLKIDYVRHIGTDQLRYEKYADTINDVDLNLKLDPFKECDILFFQAGADVHIDDPLGRMLTTGQMKHRDRIVFQFAKTSRIPIVWNLAGGYQTPIEKVILLHRNTFQESISVYTASLK